MLGPTGCGLYIGRGYRRMSLRVWPCVLHAGNHAHIVCTVYAVGLFCNKMLFSRASSETWKWPAHQHARIQCPSPHGTREGEGGADPGPGGRHDQVGAEVPGGERHPALRHECRGLCRLGEVRWVGASHAHSSSNLNSVCTIECCVIIKNDAVKSVLYAVFFLTGGMYLGPDKKNS